MLRSALLPAPYNFLPVRVRTGTCHSFTLARASQAIVSPLFSRFDLHFHRFRQPRVSLRAVRRSPATSSRRRRRRGTKTNDDKFDYYDDGGEDFEDDDVVLGGNNEYYYDDDGDEDEDEEGGDEEGMMPFEKMRKWFKHKPRGFGEGKVYDTSVEDKLLDEMRQSREAQAANLKKLKSGVVNSKNSEEKKKDAQVVPIGGRVRLVNLPKKKNIHKDLKSAFEGIPGIVNIVPAVIGNKKTRDPICKGFAFVDFKCEADAVRFIELYSGQSIGFGKIQKPIKCEFVNAHSSSPVSPKSSANLNTTPLLMVSGVEEDSNEVSNVKDSALSSWDGTTLDVSDEADNQIYREGEAESSGEEPDSATVLKGDYDESEEDEEESSVGDQVAATAFMTDYDDSVEEEEDLHAAAAFMADYDDSVEEEDEEGSVEDQDAATAFMDDDDDSVEMQINSEIGSLSLEQIDRNPTAEPSSSAEVGQESVQKKKRASKQKGKKVPKLDVPGSAKRLKIKEKAVLSDVFAKYGSKAAVAASKES
ncbi:uncharacterized protein LOC130939971 [Arachis stenosperma]|uniref:uncharacterized protein LOC130939971 n=1 Tax=Arachis stenosperma TaxID=217475 RepID=UPI0025ACABC8|nr:uncharacterized protein LOC130939971 [Arachis stenosperma]XP_057724021.1 uncharacterized protein LOC130939971 [Arachis stenosperma]